ncbi:hypothetical protein G5B31_13065 [Rhodobacter sp. SGA-6-6]|uniref:hypothetical protein n=1 Tax=Rhodobacter sp. SGA-6-6 TaxID=2710882 RepID=UPI0013EC0336|nr:hypothetical protein [Rhodobacter sp. SGA-6-6]NGM46466.1 hypothetical protein [Rhodobacter sp. SGA-6-6]
MGPITGKELFDRACDFADKITDGHREKILAHATAMTVHSRHETKKALFFRLLGSVTNANMKAKVIWGSGATIQQTANELRKALLDYDASEVLKKWGAGHEALLEHLKKGVTRAKDARDSGDRSIWLQFAKSTLSAAAFVESFPEVGDFYRWAEQLIEDPRNSAALPLVISQEVFGLGYTLACDFIKESGFPGYGKPDTHIRNLLFDLELCPRDAPDYVVQRRLIELAKEADVTPYTFDKVLYLIGSGRFDDAGLAKIKGQRAQFVESVRRQAQR